MGSFSSTGILGCIHVNLPGKGRRIKDTLEVWGTFPPLRVGKRGRKLEGKVEGPGKSTRRVWKKKNRKSVGKRNYRLMRRSFHHVAFERASAIDRCFTTKVIRVFVRPLFFLFSSKRLHVHVSTSHVFRNTAFAMIHRCRNPLSDSTETPTTDLEIR